ncbi:glycoside hydrolase domain-containing protein [Nocardioides yefusunii]|uniref:Glycoside hydrolase domain-containing protein n=1 Tax=Nocardioides yefusunii TaxID=2500546 RepID=A0ABW1QXD7_9ACTN|nr:glycoside hydrolase domain-containing protein [Nocardioides yefusunii]
MRLPSLKSVALSTASALTGLALTLGVMTPPATAANPVTPGQFTGYGFDQCVAPTQAKMDAWLQNSPFLAVGIYVSGDSRSCRTQPNLTLTWVSTQLAKGWRLLPIALGPQASCNGSFPRYRDDQKIIRTPGSNGKYAEARAQARVEAKQNVADVKKLGIVKGSTIYYDLEHFDSTNTHCRESALAFVSAWSAKVKTYGYVPGLYGGASSTIAMVDDARVNRPGKFTLPSQIWIARWDGKANTAAPGYVSDAGWKGGRIKQYLGDHDETHGGVKINIDSNWLDLGTKSRTSKDRRCGKASITNTGSYPIVSRARIAKGKATKAQVKAVQCLLREQGYKRFQPNGNFGPLTRSAVRKYRISQGLPSSTNVTRTTWVRLLSDGRSGSTPVLKTGSTGTAVHRVQQALTAARVRTGTSTGHFDATTRSQVAAYQSKVGLQRTGVVNAVTWAKLFAGNA